MDLMTLVALLHLVLPINGLIWLGIRRENERRERHIRELTQRIMLGGRRF